MSSAKITELSPGSTIQATDLFPVVQTSPGLDTYKLTATQVQTFVLSSYAGASSITTVGTIGSGTWQGSVIAGQYGGTGVNNSGKTITLGGNFTTSGAFATTLTVTGTTNVTLPTTGTLVAQGVITGSGLTIATARLAGRTTASTGAIEEISVGTGLTLSAGTLSVASDTYQPLDADLTALAALGTTGISARTASNTWALRTITGTASRVSVTNGDGVAGNPTLDIDAAYVGQTSITTLGTISTGTWQGSIIGATYGGTGNGFTAFTGPTTSTKTFTLPNASATILTSNSAVTVFQGGTGVSSASAGSILAGTGGSTLSVVAGNAAVAKRYLVSYGDGATPYAPSFAVPSAADIAAGILGAAYGGTGNGFTAFTGPTTSTKTFTLPNASATILTDNAVVTGAQGGTGVNNSGKTITLGGNFTTSGAFATTLTVTNTTNVTLPTTGTLIAQGVITGSGLTMNTARILGRTTASSGAIEEISVGSTLSLSAGSLDVASNYSGNSSITTVGTIGTGTWQGSIIAGAYGGTGNGFFAVSGPTTSLKTFTFPNASATVLTTDALVTVAQGGTGVGTLTGIVKGNGTSAFSAAVAGTDYLAPGSQSGATVSNLVVQDIRGSVSTLATSGTVNINLTSASLFRITPSGTVTFTFTHGTSTNQSQVAELYVTNGGGVTINWPAGTRFDGGTAPALSSSGTDHLTLKYDSSTAAWTVLIQARDVKAPA